MTEHFSAPWRVKRDGVNSAAILDVEGVEVCFIYTDYEDLTAAQLRLADLIAAAPDLLAACQAAEERFHAIAWDDRPDHAMHYPEREQLRAAIAKATEDRHETQ